MRGDLEKDRVAECLVGAVKCQFHSNQLQAFLLLAETTSDAAVRQQKIKEHAPLMLLTVWCLCVRIQIEMVEAADVLDALHGELVQISALKVARYLEAFEPYEHANTICIILAGLGLTQRNSTQRKHI